MYLSKYFLPLIKETPREAKLASHILMLKSAMIYQITTGIYSWLPLGKRVLKKIEEIIREEQNYLFSNEVLLPTIQPAYLWKKSGRYNVYGKEMLRIVDRFNQDLLYGPTAEEVMIDIFMNHCQSYKDLPKIFYQINWKFRDEIRPRFGLMRCREFFMKDAYSFDKSFEDAKKTYYLMYKTYINIFKRLGLSVKIVKAKNGPIGGAVSHEFHVLTNNGESNIYYDNRLNSYFIKYNNINQFNDFYAMSDNMHNINNCFIPKKYLNKSCGIEVGHIFYLGKQYSKSMGCFVFDKNGKKIFPYMGCFGIGVSRLVSTLIEVNHDNLGILWPVSVAPFKIGILNLSINNSSCVNLCNYIYNILQYKSLDVLYDDRNERAGVKFVTMDLIGIPWHLIVTSKSVDTGILELKNRRTNKREMLSIENMIIKLCLI